MTVQEEVIDDALAALELLRSQIELTPDQIVIVGHDLGGALAASIARASRRVAGLVILSGSLRPRDAIIRDEFVVSTGPRAQGRDHSGGGRGRLRAGHRADRQPAGGHVPRPIQR